MINLEFIFRLVEVVRGSVNTTMYLLGLCEKPKKDQVQEPKTQQVLKGMNFFVELYLSMRAGAMLLAETAHVLSQPSMAALAVIAVAPPPLLIALYAIASAYQLYKIAKEVSVLLREDSSGHEHQKARMEIAHAAVVLTACLAIIASNFIMPGAANMLALSCILAGAAFKAAQYSLTYFSKKESVALEKDLAAGPVKSLKNKNQSQEVEILTQSHTASIEAVVTRPVAVSPKIKDLGQAFILAEKKLESAQAAETPGVIELQTKGERCQKVEPVSQRLQVDLEKGALEHVGQQTVEKKHLHISPAERGES